MRGELLASPSKPEYERPAFASAGGYGTRCVRVSEDVMAEDMREQARGMIGSSTG
jgi:hypothetical protein